jgi:hypothetical protein
MILSATGHRPDKLGGYGNRAAHQCLVQLAYSYVIATAPTYGIVGMAQGWDTACAEAFIMAGVPFVAAVPFAGQESKWPREAQVHYHYLLACAARVVTVCDGGYAPHKMQIRNAWMVDHSNTMMALWDGSKGGTANCVHYAKAVGRPISQLWDRWVEMRSRPGSS